MSISIRSLDDAGTEGIGGASTNHFTYGYFGIDVLPADGDAIVLVICTDQGDNHVTSVTDDAGNTYSQLPGAFISSNSGGPNGTGYIMDIWFAENIATIDTDPSVTNYYHITVNTSGTAAHFGVSVLGVTGINGGNKSATTSSAANAANPQPGPALNSSDSSALYITALQDTTGTGFSGTNPGSGWSTGPRTGTHSGNYDLPFDGFDVQYAVAFMIGTGAQQTSWAQSTAGFPAAFTGAVFGIAGGSGGSGGGGSTDTDIFLGTVRVVGSAPSGLDAPSNPFLGTVKVISSPPSGRSNPYLGTVVLGTPAANNTNPMLGEVVVVTEVPAGAVDDFWGTVEEG